MAKDVVDNTYSMEKATMPKKCPNCGMMNPYTRTVCRKCKTELPAQKKVIRCPKCGGQLYEDEAKCPECGLPMEEVIAQGGFVYDTEKMGVNQYK